ncbi:MAG: formate/nitrite transporter family protein [Ruthenibacterium sp.]
MKNTAVFLRAVLAGMMVGVGGTVFLSTDNKIVGSFLFSLGLFAICQLGLWLYTGKIGYAYRKKAGYPTQLLLTWLGNFAGTAGVASVMRLTRIGDAISEKAAAMCSAKLADNLWSILILSVFCGILMALAVENYARNQRTFAGVFGLILCVMVFILCSFEHCIANMFYFTVANVWSFSAFVKLLVMTLGNSIGGIAFLWVEQKTAAS